MGMNRIPLTGLFFTGRLEAQLAVSGNRVGGGIDGDGMKVGGPVAGTPPPPAG